MLKVNLFVYIFYLCSHKGLEQSSGKIGSAKCWWHPTKFSESVTICLVQVMKVRPPPPTNLNIVCSIFMCFFLNWQMASLTLKVVSKREGNMRGLTQISCPKVCLGKEKTLFCKSRCTMYFS